MKTDLEFLPARKRDEILQIRDLILQYAQVEMVILFGSYARSQDKKQWVSEKYVKEGRVYEYNSDFDFLVVVKNKKMEEDFGIWDLIESKAYELGVRTWFSLLVDNVDYVNEQLALGRYFYSDVVREGVVLYDSGSYKLANPRDLTAEERREIAAKDFDYWFSKGEYFFDDFQANLEKERLNMAAFYLHQAVERYVAAALLVCTGYRPKSHDLKFLLDRAVQVDQRLRAVFFPLIDADLERGRFELLRRAYVDARYENDYQVEREDLIYLALKVEDLRDLVKDICSEKI